MLYDVSAPAKLNLFLHVVGRRADGYHLLQTAFRFIGLYDTLSFETRRDGQLSCDNSQDVAPESDLVLRAARLLQTHTGARQGAHIVCRKQIPAGGGLGGGSSDAASTLIALNRLWQTGLDRPALMRLSQQLGADVPAFLFGQPSFAQGIGEQLAPVAVPDCAYLVIQPDAFVSTAEVFAAPNLTRNTKSIKMADFVEWQKHGQKQGLQNDLEAVVMQMHPAVFKAREWLKEQLQQPQSQQQSKQQQQGSQLSMTGSGACLFAQMPDMRQAIASQQQIASKIGGGSQETGVRQVWACAGLQDHPLRYW
jgi:4-diphosphocytidyl-2-C-methyl-D-erythritol kinase